MRKKGTWSSLALAAVCAVSPLAGCSEGGGDNGGNDLPENAVIVSEIRRNADGTETFLVGGEPFLYLGAESRFEAYVNCDRASYEDYEKYIKAAADLGFNVLAVSVDWADIETEKDVYDFTVINRILGYALQYDIKIELLWYSALMCGDSHEWHLPDYIFEETPRYQMYVGGLEATSIENSTIYGERTFLRIDDETFMERERKVVEALMAHIYAWEEARSFPKVLIGVQVYNEADAFPEVRLDAYDVSLNGQKLTKDEAWNTVCTAMENCAKAFKSSPYQVITRTNLLRPACADLSSPGPSPIERAQQLYALESLDAVGFDPYFNHLTDLKTSILYYQAQLPQNFTHIAENGRTGTTGEGTYVNGDGEILLSISLNCGYILYELASPKAFDEGGYSQGIIDAYTLEDYSYTQAIRSMCFALRAVSPVAASVNPADFAAFNVDSSTGRETWSKTVNTTSVSCTFTTTQGAKGFAIVQDGYVYVYASGEATLTLGNGTFGQAERGSFADGAWAAQETRALENNTISLGGDGVWRIPVLSTEGALQSNTELFKG